MPVYEYYFEKCEREVQLTLSIREHNKLAIKCRHPAACGLLPKTRDQIPATILLWSNSNPATPLRGRV
jgi:hypothetical protein